MNYNLCKIKQVAKANNLLGGNLYFLPCHSGHHSSLWRLGSCVSKATQVSISVILPPGSAESESQILINCVMLGCGGGSCADTDFKMQWLCHCGLLGASHGNCDLATEIT
jgi:hypothetical protein